MLPDMYVYIYIPFKGRLQFFERSPAFLKKHVIFCKGQRKGSCNYINGIKVQIYFHPSSLSSCHKLRQIKFKKMLDQAGLVVQTLLLWSSATLSSKHAHISVLQSGLAICTIWMYGLGAASETILVNCSCDMLRLVVVATVSMKMVCHCLQLLSRSFLHSRLEAGSTLKSRLYQQCQKIS